MKRSIDKFPEKSGNTVNGLGKPSGRRPSPFIYHLAGAVMIYVGVWLVMGDRLRPDI